MKQRIQVDIPMLDELQPLIDKHNELAKQLEDNAEAIRSAWLEIEIKINQPTEGESTD